MPAWPTHAGVVIGLGIVVLLSSLFIGGAATEMTEHGVSVNDFQLAGTSVKAERAYDRLGPDGRDAAWRFLGLELPFLIAYGLLLSAGCAFAAGRLALAGAGGPARAARFATCFGLLAAGSDLIQNSALAVTLTGRFDQPAPRIAQVGGTVTWVFGIAAGFVFVVGWAYAALLARRAP